MYQLHPQLSTDTFKIGQLSVCEVLLMNDCHYPWLILVPRREGIMELYQLDSTDLSKVQAESIAVSKLMMNFFKGDKFNFGALGNMVPQLHLHHIVRLKSDTAWPKPVWGVVAAEPYSANVSSSLITELQALFTQNFADFSAC